MIIVWGIVAIVGLVAYLRKGLTYAIADLPAAWTRARRYWGTGVNPAYIRDSVRWSFVRMLFLWPGIRLVSVFDAALQSGDPKTIARRQREEAAKKLAFDLRTAHLEQLDWQWRKDHPDPLETI